MKKLIISLLTLSSFVGLCIFAYTKHQQSCKELYEQKLAEARPIIEECRADPSCLSRIDQLIFIAGLSIKMNMDNANCSIPKKGE